MLNPGIYSLGDQVITTERSFVSQYGPDGTIKRRALNLCRAAPIHPADEGDTTTMPGTLEAAARNLAEVGFAPTRQEPCVLAVVYHYAVIWLKNDNF